MLFGEEPIAQIVFVLLPAGEVFLKLENLQPIGAYKVRSMGNVMLSATPDTLRHGAYTASSGNAPASRRWSTRRTGASEV